MKFAALRVTVLLCLGSVAAAAVTLWPIARRVQTSDRNGDGQPDLWRRYDTGGQLVEIDVDRNFDGSPDLSEFYVRGALVRRETDRNFRGQADLVEEFDATTHHHVRSIEDLDGDGTADVLVLFREGRPVFSKRARTSADAGAHRVEGPATPGGADRRLARLNDPFQFDEAWRGTALMSNVERGVGLSTSGGLPGARVAASGGLAPSLRVDARGTSLALGTPAQPHASRAPPLV
jgi:hypothetical protein